VVSFTLLLFYPGRNLPRYSLDRRWGGPQSRPGRGGLPCGESNTGRPARSSVTILTELFRPHSKSSTCIYRIRFLLFWFPHWASCWFIADVTKISHYIRGLSKIFRTESITKCTLPFGITRWESTQRLMTAKLTRLTHKKAIQPHLVVESCTICSSRSRWSVRKLLDTPSNIPLPRFRNHIPLLFLQY
jgi:hypothetical protein